MDAATLLGSDLGVFIGLTVVLFGGISALTGEALAMGWKPAWLCLPYALISAAANRFMNWALFDGDLLAAPAFLLHFVLLAGVSLVVHRIFHVARMVRQYPWLYETSGLFNWRDKQ